MPSFFDETRPKARKKHRCCECRGDILPGEHYQKVVGVWSGDFSWFKICGSCEELRDWMRDRGVDSCFGNIYEMLHESGLYDEYPLFMLAMQADG